MNEWEQKEGEGGGVGVGERDEQAHPILIPGQAGVHSCRCSHSRAWIWLGKSSIIQLILQEAAYSGAAVRNALSRVCAGVPQPCMRACSTRVRVLSVHRAGLAVRKQKTASPAPREGDVCDGEGRASLLCCRQIHLAQPALLWHPLWAQRSTVGANKKGAHVQARLRNCSRSFPLKPAEQNPSPHSGGTEL